MNAGARGPHQTAQSSSSSVTSDVDNMKSAATAIICSCVLVSALRGVDAFVAPASTFQQLDTCGGQRWRSSSRGGVEQRLGARPGLANVNAGAGGAKRGRGCQQQQQRQQQVVLKAQMTDEEMAVDQALIQRVAQEVEKESGVELEQLINPGKVINLERDLVKLRAALESDRGSERDAIEQEIAKKESTLAVEKRTYMKGWLKKIFVGQAVITTVLGGLMAYDAVPFFPDVDLSIRVLGFWFVWLFTVPSLRARKPGEAEKVALNIAFLATPVVSFAMPFVTKDPVTIYWANILVLTACYGYGFTVGKPDGDTAADQNQPQWLKFIYKSLDFGSGKERGARAPARDVDRDADDDDDEEASATTAV